MKIDAHHYFFDKRFQRTSAGNCLDAPHEFLPKHLEDEMRETGVTATLVVQSGSSIEETKWLLALSETYSFVKGVIGCCELLNTCKTDLLSDVVSHPRFRGLIYDFSGDALKSHDVVATTDYVRSLGATMDIILMPSQIEEILPLVDRHSNLRFVVASLKGNDVTKMSDAGWETAVRQLGKRPNVVFKLSGLRSCLDKGNSSELRLWNDWNKALEAFGPHRLMFGSDWPKGHSSGAYRKWQDMIETWIASLSPDEQLAVWAHTARDVYGI